ncbi:monovalent cation/H+ antiporter complex subunit F [Geodermatophilus sp. DSM 44513]|uniref:monovalent cation/H+ antiporter complex subunit F n=1 Tax=Geodermatophilus sp. DSM 44513 TaxID=1528104 RepID=UPI001271CF41|nr:monovalent cation/H+ antiporter complex subunit F [Geodermatophilus sp. DSM 44513]WNV73744.1 monovalent cation/H+ antiporter complex subunit F [Geodermatophilus sp. DSM 44513]
MTAVLTVTAGLLLVAGVLVLIRLFRGPTVYDRLVALDVLTLVVLGGILVEALWRDRIADVVLLAVVTLVAFLSTMSVLRFDVEDQR